MKALVARFIAEEDGQDLIEYALLSVAIGLASIVGLSLLQSAINTGYTARNSGVNNLWETPDPGGS